MPTYEEEIERLTKEIEEIKKKIKMRPPTEQEIENNKTMEKFIKEAQEQQHCAYLKLEENIKSSDHPDYVTLRKHIADKNIGDEHHMRKMLYFREMHKMAGYEKMNEIDWTKAINEYCEYQSQYEDITTFIDGVYKVWTKKNLLPKQSDADKIKEIIEREYEKWLKNGGLDQVPKRNV
jgi:hypothetical protein